jgi:hypothetical protein
MFEFTHNNHYKFTYNDKPFVFRTSNADRFGTTVGKCGGPAGDWRFENQRAAKLIFSKARPGQRIRLFYSGGIDSEVMVMAFIDAGVPFDCVIIDMGTEINGHDTAYAYKFCNQHSISYQTVKVDPIEFVNTNQHFLYNQEYQVKQLAMMIVMRALDMLSKDDIYLLGGEIFMTREIDLDQFYSSNNTQYTFSWYNYVREDNDISYFKYALLKRVNLITEFFCYTPEQMLSYLEDPLLVDLVNDRIDYKYSLMSSKSNVYSRYYTFEPRPKYHGYENVMHLNNRVYLDLKEGDVNSDIISRIKYRDLIKQLRYD